MFSLTTFKLGLLLVKTNYILDKMSVDKTSLFSRTMPLVIFFSVAITGLFSQTPVLEIWEIQGSTDFSPYNNSIVGTHENIVTAIGTDRFFIQTPTDRSDNDALTSDGIMVYTGSTPILSVSDRINVTGLIQEYEGVTEFAQEGLIYEVIFGVGTW